MILSKALSVETNITAHGSERVTTILSYGWVHQCNGRGTLDIIQSCLITIFLCSWSVLCLNIPEETTGRWNYLRNKIHWMLFAIVFPEVITAIGAEQWESASQCVEDITALGYEDWTMRHALFANMGGFISASPDFPTFPIDGLQLSYLVSQNYLPLPDVTEKTIWDKNKADGFARTITILQIGWFCVQCIGRAFQHLPISTLELTTLTFIFCTLCTFFFWNHKPLDVEACITLRTDTPIAEILTRAGDQAQRPYSRTPLDFITPERSKTSLLSLFWLGLENLLKFDMESTARPVQAFGESKTTPPRGLRVRHVCFGFFFTFSYFGLHLVAWNFTFPTTTERILWRSASLMLLGTLAFYLLCLWLLVSRPWWVSTILWGKKAKTIFEINTIAPKWAKCLSDGPVLGVYALARGYILIEGLVSLRALSLGVYRSVNWSNFIPHL